MAEKFDVSSRLAEGHPAVENLQHYVWACRQLGYQHPDLTLNAAQLRDWYGSEEGMDLGALQSDCLALDAAVGSTQEALAVQDRQLSALSAAWRGEGAEASRDFLRRHGEASAAAAAAVRTAAEALGALRENLWRAVDAKVDAVVTVEGSAQGDWLAAAETVTTGAGDRAAAAELVDRAVKPFVDNSVRVELLTAMRATMSAVADAYQRATAEIAAEYQPVFDVPGDLGPTWSPPPARVETDCENSCDERSPAAATFTAAPAAPAATAPSAWSAPVAAPSVPPAAPPEPPVPPQAPTAPPAPPMSPVPPLGGMGSGMPDVGSGLSGLGQQFADTLGGLLGGAGGGVPEPPDLDVPELDEPLDDPEEPEADDLESDDEEEVEEEPILDEIVAGEPDQETCGGSTEVPVEQVAAPAPTPAPPPAEPLPPVEPLAGPVASEQTPCAIAADELPQVGEPPE
jgi:uncharacterized protein YukE